MRDKHVGALKALVEEVPIKCNFISKEKWSDKPLPNKWSKKEILGHLVDSAINNLRRFNEMQFEPSPYKLIPYKQDDLVKSNNYQNQKLDQIVNLWKFLNIQIIKVWKSTPVEILQHEIIAYEDQSFTVETWMHDYIKHAHHHLNQIFNEVIPLSSLTNSRVTVTEALEKLKDVAPEKDAVVFSYGTMEVEIYVPEKIDHQEPHTRDEIYVVIEGEGDYELEGTLQKFGKGDVLFAPAGARHRFKNFSDNFKTWVIFYGPIGGE